MSNKVEITGINTNNLPKISAREQLQLMERIKHGDMLARDQFAMANLRLVLSVVQRFRDRCNSPDDMFQVGCVGLMKAIDNFDLSLNVKFSTYAVPMIIGEIKRSLRDNNSIRVSRSLRDIAYRALKAREELYKSGNLEPSIIDIAGVLGVSVKSISIALEAISDPLSLSDPIYEDGDDSIFLLDQLSNSDDKEDNWLEKINLKDALARLSKREKEIVNLRYFIGKTQMEVSDEIGISQAQVSRLEKTAIEQIRKSF